MPPTAHESGQLYRYHFTIYRDLGPQREMEYVTVMSALGATRDDALLNLVLASNERVMGRLPHAS